MVFSSDVALPEYAKKVYRNCDETLAKAASNPFIYDFIKEVASDLVEYAMEVERLEIITIILNEFAHNGDDKQIEQRKKFMSESDEAPKMLNKIEEKIVKFPDFNARELAKQMVAEALLLK